MKKIQRKRVNFYMDIDLMEAIAEMSAALDMPQSEIVREASKEYLIKNGRKLKAIRAKKDNALKEACNAVCGTAS